MILEWCEWCHSIHWSFEIFVIGNKIDQLARGVLAAIELKTIDCRKVESMELF